ncbi:MAG: hypothetical protein J6S71_02080 [Clostridia bacterium]|nr:hypothetical protein [Clostridia bacterium]
MAQTLLLGLGGTGSRIVNYVASDLKKKKISINDGQICCTVLDTNENDRKKISETGVGVQIVPTSKDRIVEDYLKMYTNKGVRNWMPESPALLKESMKDGASQMRSKSRLAFMDIVEDGSIRQLENQINKLFDNRDGTKIRVMIVSSLAGGTGSGMFIQTALWLRKFFSKRKCSVTLRGIFVLPDVFINTIKDISDDETEKLSLYANAYGAIRELNALTKIKTKNYKPILPVKVDSLFDSENGQPDGQPVYDYAFFIDDISEGGSVLTQIDHYEQVVARLVYMQLYAPMHDDLYSEEDNLFKRFQKSPEPVFGSCGTAKAVYPSDDVLRYCALRAAQDSLSTGWRKIDEEIKDKQRKEDEKEKSGVVLSHRLNPRVEYVRLFDAKASKTGDQIGKDRLFVNIANDIKNEERVPGEDGSVDINYTDKIEDFIEKLDEIIASTVDTSDPGSLSAIKLKKSWIDQTTDTRDTLTTLVEKKTKDVKRFIEETDGEVDRLAEEILDIVCSSDMGDINQENLSSVFGLLTKKNNNNETYFVHPIAVRYLLYKLAARLEEIKGAIIPDTLRQCAEKGYGNGKPKISFDNPKTMKVEDDALDYLKSKALLQNEEKFIKNFKSLYAQHNGGQYELCRAYAISTLKLRLAVVFSQRLEKLTLAIEGFFKDLTKVSNSISDAIAENVRKNDETKQKIIYVCASGEEKESMYSSLRFNTSNSDVNVNKIIVRALYGQFCAKENPTAQNNIEFKGKSVEVTFFKEVISTYSHLILANNKDDIDLDIYSAICRSSDIEYEKAQADAENTDNDSDRLDIDLETGESSNANSRHQRHVEAMDTIARRLLDLGSPFLISNDEMPEDNDEHLDDNGYDVEDENDVFTPIKKRKTFWGFNPAVAAKCPELATILGVNVALQQNKAYAKNELDCYRAVYGIQAGYVDDFNELTNGKYYQSYSQIVREMIAGVGAGHPEELVHTPHLDKTWHLYLPYITPEKQLLEDGKFYRLFWLAIAYGMITLDRSGKYQIQRIKKTATGSYEKDEPILYKGEPIGKSNVIELLAALKLDGSFMIDAAKFDKQFADECDKIENYEGTEFLRGSKESKKVDGETTRATVGGLASKLDTNAVTMIVRYHNSPKHDDDVTAMMIQSLEKLCCELVANKYESSEQAKIQYKGYELCKRIYTASAMKEKDIDLIKHWKKAWAKSSAED